jgi:hypothetical protein
MTKPNRGRLQAQSDALEESEAWAQDEPPSWQKGLHLLKKLEEKLSKKERGKREKQFRQAERFIRNAGNGRGVGSPLKISFENEDYDDGTRVDIEVPAGWFAVGISLILLAIIFCDETFVQKFPGRQAGVRTQRALLPKPVHGSVERGGQAILHHYLQKRGEILQR